MSLIDLIFPKNCLECGRDNVYICDFCLNEVPQVGWHEGNIFSVWRYKGVIKKAIIALKYKYSTEIASEIGENVVEILKSKKIKITDIILVPIPLHRVKKNLRGFNQSEEVGRVISKSMKWKFLPNLLVKSVPTKPQAKLSKDQREKNLKGSFKLNSAIKTKQYLSKTIFLFDDVYTTGSTLKEAIKVLKINGFKAVYGLTMCR